MTDTLLTPNAASVAGSEPVLAIQDLSVSFRGRSGENQALKGISFNIHQGEIVAVVGESGSGKSVTSLAVMGLLAASGRIDRGSMQFRDRQGHVHQLATLNETQRRALRGREMAMIFQEPMTSLNPVLRVGDQLTEALRDHQICDKSQADSRARELLRQVRIADVDRVMKSYPHSLSGGMRQRVMIAQALACDPQLLIADEPTTALDVCVQAQTLELLDSLRRELRMGLLLITHDLGVVRQQADRVIIMHDGLALEHRPTAELFSHPAHPYSQGLLNASLGRDHGQHYLDNRLPEIQVLRTPGQANCYKVSSTLYRPGQAPRPGAAHTTPLLQVENLSLGYGEKDVLSGLSFGIGERETVGLVGESGCGKSTLSKALLGLLKPRQGVIAFNGRDITGFGQAERLTWRGQLQMIFQDPYAALNPRHSVEAILDRVQRLHGLNDAGQRAKAREAMLDAVGLARNSLNRLPHQFSGGQRQRIGIARALIVKPRLVICDEPVSALDVSTQAQILNLLVELREAFNLSYLFISHDLSVVRYLADRVMVMHDARIVEQATPQALWQQPQHSYTQRLLAAIPGSPNVSAPPRRSLSFAVAC